MPHDAAYKSIFTHQRAVQDLLQFLAEQLPEQARELLDQLDLSQMTETKTEFVDEFFQRHLGDKVWEVPFRSPIGDCRKLRVVVLLEFQSRIDRLMALRVQGFSVLNHKDRFKNQAPGSPTVLAPFLAVVIYNGAQEWTAKQSMAELVDWHGGPTEPDAARRLFAGERYELVDVRAHMKARRPLPEANVISMVMRTETMADRQGEPGVILEEIAEMLSEPEMGGLKETLVDWFVRVAGRYDVAVDFLQNKEVFERLVLEGTIRTVADECFERRFAILRAQGFERGIEEGVEHGIEQGIEHERKLLCRQTERKFGVRTANRVAKMLMAIDDPGRLEEVGDWIIDYEESNELLRRIETVLQSLGKLAAS